MPPPPTRSLFRRRPYFRYAGLTFQERAYGAFQGWIIHINMRHLMIGNCKNPARPGVKQFAPQFFLYRQPAAFAKQPVKMNRHVHRTDSVFREQNHLDGLLFKESQQIAHDRINPPEVGGNDFSLYPPEWGEGRGEGG